MRGWTLLMLLGLTACGPLWVKLTDDTGEPDTPPLDSEPEGDTDTDTDADSDTDSDADGDADTDTTPIDDDGDGYTEDVDCDDDDETVHPDAEEICGDGVDNDCDGAATGCGLSGEYLSSDADAILLGEEDGDLSGSSIAGVGDVNNDGYDDILVGAYFNDEGGYRAGAAYLVYGPISGETGLGSADAKLTAEGAEDFAGFSVAGAGDTNNDGYADLLVGAPTDDAGSSNTGTTYLVLGPVSGDMDLSASDARLMGVTGDCAGASVASAGDVNDDGFDDILVSAQYNSEGESWAGAAYLVLGPTSGDLQLESADARFLGEHRSGEFGASLAGAGDVNGDGFDDVVLGQWMPLAESDQGGTAHLFLGPMGGDVSQSSADATLTGEVEDDLAGMALDGAGDVDGDGYDDLIIGAPGHGVTGAAYLVLGPISGEQSLDTAQAKFVDDAEGSTNTGTAVAGVGDLNLDGFGDLMVAACRHGEKPSGTGAAYIVLGPVTGELNLATADARIRGETASGLFGSSVDSAGDVDGDGTDDILIGATSHGPTPEAAGATYLFLTPGF